MTLSHILSLCSFASDTRPNTVPRQILDHAKLVLLDTIGVIIAGSRLSETRQIADRLPGRFASKKGVTCPGRPNGFHPLSATLINGVAGSSLEYEEGNLKAMGHPAIQVVPALMAAAESVGQSGADLLSGLISGYEVSSRISRASSIRKGLHPTGTWGIVGSAIGVGRVCGKRAEELLEIANIAASYLLSPYVGNSFAGYNIASTFAGLVNHHALISNLLHESGIRAHEACFEMAFSRFVSEDLRPDVLDSPLGLEYSIAENYFKPYPSCRFTHPAIDAVKAILQKIQVDPRDITRIVVTSFRAAVHTSTHPPANIEAVRFSVPYLIATLLLYSKIDLGTLNEECLHNPTVTELAGKVDMVFSPEYEAMRPINNPARVAIRLTDGREISHEVLNPLGDPANPMSERAIQAKFLSLAEPVIGRDRAQGFLEGVTCLEQARDIRPLLALLRPAA